MISIIALLILLLILLLAKTSQRAPSVPSRPTPLPTFIKRPTFTPVPVISKPAVDMEKITISEVEMDNFYKKGEKINPQNDILIEKKDNFQIVYLSQFNKFLISILSSPFETARKEAEVEFLTTLGITEEEACLLNVSITTPFFANPDYAGKDFPLSFCK